MKTVVEQKGDAGRRFVVGRIGSLTFAKLEPHVFTYGNKKQASWAEVPHPYRTMFDVDRDIVREFYSSHLNVRCVARVADEQLCEDVAMLDERINALEKELFVLRLQKQETMEAAIPRLQKVSVTRERTSK